MAGQLLNTKLQPNYLHRCLLVSRHIHHEPQRKVWSWQGPVMAGQLLMASTSLTAFLVCTSVQWCLASLLVLVEHGPGTVQESLWLFVCSAVRQPRVHPLPSLHSLQLR